MNPESNHDTEISPELEPLHLTDKPDGPGAAMMISAGLSDPRMRIEIQVTARRGSGA